MATREALELEDPAAISFEKQARKRGVSICPFAGVSNGRFNRRTYCGTAACGAYSSQTRTSFQYPEWESGKLMLVLRLAFPIFPAAYLKPSVKPDKRL